MNRQKMARLLAGARSVHQEPDLGYLNHPRTGSLDDLSQSLEKVEQLRRPQIKKLWEDCLGICWFAAWCVKDVTKTRAESMGGSRRIDDFTTGEAMAAGERRQLHAHHLCAARIREGRRV